MENMEAFDPELLGVMGSRYDDGETPKEMPTMERKTIGPNPQAKPTKLVEKTPCPFPKPPKGLADKLISCTTWLCICGGISMLLWWFEINGLMAQEAAYPCILASSCIGSGGVVWNIK